MHGLGVPGILVQANSVGIDLAHVIPCPLPSTHHAFLQRNPVGLTETLILSKAPEISGTQFPYLVWLVSVSRNAWSFFSAYDQGVYVVSVGSGGKQGNLFWVSPPLSVTQSPHLSEGRGTKTPQDVLH